MKETHTPPRSVRVHTDLWEAAKAKAEQKGETMTDVIRRALERYVKQP
jgi:predicted HicB family RNase H-like nuclease